MEYAVEIIALSKRFVPQRGLGAVVRGTPVKEFFALDAVSFSVEAREVFGLAGPNGAGKTTLMKILCTLLIPTAGIARVGGLNVLEDAAEVRRLIGLVTSNERSFYWRLTGRQNLLFFAALYGLPRQATPWIEELLDALDLRAYADRRFDSYSTGIRQRLAIARALLHQPRILLMDEPTKGLDPTAAAALIRLLRERIVPLWGPTIIITSHNLRETEQLCSRVAIMQAGQLLCCGRLDELRRNLFPHTTYRLTTGKLSPSAVEAIANLQGVVGVRAMQGQGSLALEMQLTTENGALSAVLRTVLANGGEVYHCSEVPVSLEEVFDCIVSSSTGG